MELTVRVTRPDRVSYYRMNSESEVMVKGYRSEKVLLEDGRTAWTESKEEIWLLYSDVISMLVGLAYEMTQADLDLLRANIGLNKIKNSNL